MSAPHLTTTAGPRASRRQAIGWALWLAWRHTTARPVATALASLALALAGAQALTLWIVADRVGGTFASASGGFDAVLGARGSKLQLVLCALYHLEPAPGLVRAAELEAIRRRPEVAAAYPIALGDNYLGYRVVGTVPELFTAHEWRPGEKFRLREGALFAGGERQAVAGVLVAQALGLRVGSSFQPYHGLDFHPDTQHTEVYTVVGVLEPTGTPADRVLWVPLAAVQNMAGHDPNAASDVSAVLLKLKRPEAGMRLDLLYNRQGDRLTFAWPVASLVAQLFDRFGWVSQVLAATAVVSVLVALCTVVVVLGQAMQARLPVLITLRALGARRTTVVLSLLVEGVLLAVVGAVGALGLAHLAATGIAHYLQQATGVLLPMGTWHPALAVVPLGLVALGALAALYPAWLAYRLQPVPPASA